MLKHFFLTATILILGTPSLASACTCGLWPGSCNQAWKAGQVIFTGTVTGKLTSNETSFTQNAFQFAVSESFRGPAIGGQNITVYTGMGGGDCGYQFNLGATYLVYASEYNGKLVTGICTLTSPAARMQATIRQLRALGKGERVADVFGMISTSPLSFADDPSEIKPLAGKRVRVIGSRNLEQSTTTDDEGIYSFPSLPADTYRLEVDPPEGMSTWQRNKGEPYKIELGAQGVSGCPASLSFVADGRIKGKVVDENGNGVAGFVTLEVLDPKEAEAAKWRGGLVGYDTESGEFELALLRPNKYRLLFRRKIDGRVDFRVPPVRSEVITIGLGQHVDDFHFNVSAVRL